MCEKKLKIKEYFKLLRVVHWIKNLFVFVPLLYSKNLFNQELFTLSLRGVFAFSFLASTIYIINDILDADFDRQHPHKKDRPIAKGTVKIKEAVSIMFLLSAGIILLVTGTGWQFPAVLFAYFIINTLYSFKFKNIAIIDILCIASGFTLRIVGGAFLINVSISSWLVLTTLFISLFLAIMKRRSEILNISHFTSTRIVLREYTEGYLNVLSTISATAVIVCYALYTVSEKTIVFFQTENLVYTMIFVIYGIFRFMYLIIVKKRDENVAELILMDKSLLINIGLYIIFTAIIIY